MMSENLHMPFLTVILLVIFLAILPSFHSQHFEVNSIHWTLTKEWLHYNITMDICSERKSAYQVFKIKSLIINHILPCGDVLIKHYPKLYLNTGVPCLICINHLDTNNYLGFCANLIPFINNTLKSHKDILILLIDSKTEI